MNNNDDDDDDEHDNNDNPTGGGPYARPSDWVCPTCNDAALA